MTLTDARAAKANFHVYGARKVWRQLYQEEIAVVRCTFERLMQRLGLQGVLLPTMQQPSWTRLSGISPTIHSRRTRTPGRRHSNHHTIRAFRHSLSFFLDISRRLRIE